MAKFCLSEETFDGTPDLDLLLEELRSAKEKPVFRTWVPNGSQDIILCTTNEKVHLSLGKFSRRGLIAFARLLEHGRHFVNSELVFTYQSKAGEPQPRSLFVTRSQDSAGNPIFHLAPGH